MALIVVILLFVLAGFLLPGSRRQDTAINGEVTVLGSPMLKGQTSKRAVYSFEDSKKDLYFVFDDTAAGFTTAGSKDVSLLNFSVSSGASAKLQKLIFSPGENTNPADLVSLQLYVNGDFVTEKPFLEGRAVFNDLKLRLHPNNNVTISIMAQLSAKAQAGHIVQVGLVSADDVMAQSITSSPLRVGLDFPAWSPAVSVIGSNL